MKNISIIGIGKLGLCLALNLEKKGFNILGVDINENYVQSINKKNLISNEPKVNELLLGSKNLVVTTSVEKSISFSDIIFLMVATPSTIDGKYNHDQIENVLTQLEILGYQEKTKILVIGCTTYPGYCESIVERMKKINYSVVYNPEFIAQGNIIKGQTHPDMVLIGESDEISGKKIEEIHTFLCENSPKICRMSLTEAELTKLSINCFITTKISFANMIGDLCNKLKINHQIVLSSIGQDTRIGEKYLNWGFGFGGPCFPRDNRALGILCMENGIVPSIPKASDEYNRLHVDYHAEHIYENHVIDNSIIFDGVSYKKGSVLIEESQQLKVAEKLVSLGVDVKLTDIKEVIDDVKKLKGNMFKYE